MIRIELQLKDKNIIGFLMNGHAEYDKSGQDIVCAAASMLTFNTIDTFTDILKIQDSINLKMGKNDISLVLNRKLDDRKFEDFQLIMKKFELGMISLKKSYSDYIDLKYTEV